MSKLRFEKEQLEQSLETLREFTNVEKYFQTDHGRLEELNDVLIRVQEENVALRNENIELRNYQLNIIPVVLEMQNQLYELRDILQEEEILHSRSHLNTIMEEDDAVLKLKEDISEKDETIKTLKTKLKQERETKETELEMLNARIVKFNDYKEEMHKQISQLQSIRSENDELQMLSRENNQLKLNLEKTLNELHDVKAELRKKSNEIDKLTNELDDVRFELSGEQKEVENVYLKLEQLQKQKDDELEKVTIEAVKLKTSLDENNAKLTAILHEKEVLESNLNKEISRFTATQEEKTIEMETLLKTKVSAIDELKMKLVQTEEEFTKEISNLQIERKTLKEEMTEVNTLHKIAIEDLESLLKSRDIEISELKRTLDSQVDQSKLEEEIKTLQAVNRKAKEDLDSLKKSYDYQLKLAVNFNQNEEKFQLERSKLEEEINTLKLLNKKANENLQCLKESKDIEISELKQILSSKQEEMKFELERNKLNEEIETLKAVNRKVKEDLDSLKKSYDFQLKLAHNFNQNEEKFQLERIKLEEEINTLKLLNKKVNEDLQCLKESKDIEISELKRILPSKQETMKFELERNKLNEEIMTLKVVNRKMKEDLDSLKKSYDFQLKLALNFNQKEEKFQLERTKLEEKMNTLKLLNKKANEDLQSLKESQVIEISELKRTLSSKQEELKFELEQNKLKDEIHTLKTLNLQLTEQLESLKSNLMNRDLEISELKREKTTEIHELTTQLKELKDKSNRKSGISDSMTKLLNHQMELQCLTKDNEDLKRQLDFLLRLPLNSDRLPHKSDSQDLWLLSDKSKDRIPELKKFQEFIETKCQEITTLTRVQDSLKIKIKKLEDLLKKKEEELTDLRKETDRCNRVGKIGLFTSIKGSGTEKNKIVQLKADGGFQYEPTFRNQPNKVKKTKEKSSQPRSVFSLNFGSTYSSSEEEDNGNIQNQKLDMLTNENKQLKQELARLTSIVDKPTVDNVNTHDHERPSSRLSDGKSISPNHLRRIKRQSLIDQRRGLSPDLINMFDNQESGSNNEHLEKSTNTVSVCTIDQSTQVKD
ncbi:hypothetical protein ABEB36_007746 [Hypothenemus hampei]|uniref:Uncharacterized protein n=1 Tax=Hypothenemus hampei TaxID=57062 RepID=A0ABD1EXG7_HYPHA